MATALQVVNESDPSSRSGIVDLVMIGRTEVVDLEKYFNLPLDRHDIYQDLTQLRLTWFEGGFRPYLEVLNKALYGRFYLESDYPLRRELLSIWNFNSLNATLAISQAVQRGYRCKIISNFESEFDLLVEQAAAMSRPLIGISTTYILDWSIIAKMTRQIRKAIPKAEIILGGAFINNQFVRQGAQSFKEPMAKLGIRYAVYSYNSEHDLANLMDGIRSGKLEGIANTVYVDDAGVFHANPDQWVEPELENGGVPWEKIEQQEGCSTLQMRTSTGCPFRCSFCTYPVIAKGFFFSEQQELVTQLDKIKAKDVDALIFIDDTFNVPIERFRAILEVLKRYSFRWYSFFRPQYCDEEMAKAMKESGCDGVYLGIESANDEVLKNMAKKSTAAQYRRGAQLLKKHGITTFSAFVLGFPGETTQSIDDNIRFLKETDIDFYSLKEFYYMDTAPVYQKREQFGLTGDGNNWKHATMDSTTASREKLRMFESIDSSIYVDADTSLWYLAYLRERGFSWAGIRAVQKVMNKMMVLDNQGRFKEKEAVFEELREALKPFADEVYQQDRRQGRRLVLAR